MRDSSVLSVKWICLSFCYTCLSYTCCLIDITQRFRFHRGSRPDVHSWNFLTAALLIFVPSVPKGKKNRRIENIRIRLLCGKSDLVSLSETHPFGRTNPGVEKEASLGTKWYCTNNQNWFSSQGIMWEQERIYVIGEAENQGSDISMWTPCEQNGL